MDNLTDAQKLQMEMFYKFLADAVRVLGGNPTGQAHQTRLKIEEAMMWGRTAISAYVPSEPAPATDDAA